jgi:probable rRNA maturation factor
MVKINLNKIFKCHFTKQTVAKVVNYLSQVEPKVSGEVEINIVGNQYIKKINKEFRGINKATDVLSFAWAEDKFIPTDFLGQIYISYPKIKTQATENHITIKEEFIRMLTHGILHLVGYDHQTKNDTNKMFHLQEEVVKKIC